MQKTFKGASAASGEIYDLLTSIKPNDDVIYHFSQFKSNENLYEKNVNKISRAYYTTYNTKKNIQLHIIHAVGPDFRFSTYLQEIIKDTDETKLFNLIFELYEDIYIEFIKNYKLNNKLQLRLLPISTGVFIGQNETYRIKLFKAIIISCMILNKKYEINAAIYLYFKSEYDIFNALYAMIQNN
jgi:hypothetical protein